MKAKMSKRAAFLSLFVWGFPVLAQMQHEQQMTIDQYIAERKRVIANAAPVVDQLAKQMAIKLEEVEKKGLPILVELNQVSAETLAASAALDRRLKEIQEHSNFNPYDEPEWLSSTRLNLTQLCCDVKAKPKFQQQIQSRVAQGLSPLIPRNRRMSDGANGAGVNNTRPPAGGNFNQRLGNGGRNRGGAGLNPLKRGNGMGNSGGQ